MTAHLTPDELAEVLESPAASNARVHLESCAQCRRQAEDLAAMLRDARLVDVPEPSPLFWEHFSSRVRRAIESELQASPRTPRWLAWPVLGPLGALTLLVIALVWGVARQPSATLAPDTTIASEEAAEDMSAADSVWAVVSDLVESVDFEQAPDVGIATSPGSAERAALHLSEAEQVELVRLLREELGRPGG